MEAMFNSSSGTGVIGNEGLIDERIVLAMQDMNRPIIVVLLLIAVALALYLFFLSPLCVKPGNVQMRPRPLDVEDPVFTRSDTPFPRVNIIRSPYDAFERYTDKDPLNKTLPPLPTFCASRYPVGSTREVSPQPPPAYTSFPHASAPTPWDLTNFSSLNTLSSASAGREKRSFFSFPKLWTRSPSRLVISKPIMHPEGPIPGLPIEHEHLSTDTTFLRPCAAPRSVSDTIFHYPTVYLPMPSQAYVYNRDSISPSKIGLAF